MLKFPPIKPKPISELLTYKTKSKNTGAFTYTMVDKTGQIVGKMKAKPEIIRDKYRHFSPDADVYRSFFIDRLFAYKKHIGVGKSFINIAKKESERHLCLGNIHTIASSLFDHKNPPYIFFRKMGFNFSRFNSSSAKYIDECIKTNSQVDTNIRIGDVPMYIVKNIDADGKFLEKYFKFKNNFSEVFNYL